MVLTQMPICSLNGDDRIQARATLTVLSQYVIDVKGRHSFKLQADWAFSCKEGPHLHHTTAIGFFFPSIPEMKECIRSLLTYVIFAKWRIPFAFVSYRNPMVLFIMPQTSVCSLTGNTHHHLLRYHKHQTFQNRTPIAGAPQRLDCCGQL